MRGIKECLNWMIDNPMKEIKAIYKNGYEDVRRFNDYFKYFEFKSDRFKNWFRCDSFSEYNEHDWQPYDPNPMVEFNVAYMICANNGTKYQSKDKRIDMFNYNGAVFLNVSGELDKSYKQREEVWTTCMLDQMWKKVE